MSLNKWMHPRNVFRKKPDFKALAQEYTEFEPFLKHFYNDNVTIDYKNPDALRTLCQVLLKKYFHLDIHLPPNRLIPAVPQRLNYVLWIEDLVSLLDVPSNEINGIDIGTGPSCILPFLVCRNNKSWTMKAVELDLESYSVALRNVAQNDLSSRITVVLNQEHSSKFSWIFDSNCDKTFHFLMCNPPFFMKMNGSNICEFAEEIEKKSNANESIEIESSFEGGEVAFVEELITESLIVGTRIKMYSVMLGKKSSLVSLKRLMKGHHESGLISSFSSTEFCQGKTMRWGLAWTCVPNLNLNQVPKMRNKEGRKLSFAIEFRKGLDYSIDGISRTIKQLLDEDLKFQSVEDTRHTKQSIELTLKSNLNTWSHQRRKRRQQKQNAVRYEDLSNDSSNQVDQPTLTDLKRKRDDDSDDELYSNCPIAADTKRVRDIDICTGLKDETTFLLEATLTLKKEGKSIILSLVPGDRCSNRESVHQLLQYFMNKLNKGIKS